jgi:hypothetical protein
MHGCRAGEPGPALRGWLRLRAASQSWWNQAFVQFLCLSNTLLAVLRA